MNTINKLLVQNSTRPLVENHPTCYIMKLPAKEYYTAIQQNLILGLSQECFNDVSMGNGLTFVMPFGLPYEEELWQEIADNFGDFIFVEEVL